MIRTFTLLFLTVFATLAARAGFTPVTVTGFNKDVVANGVGLPRSTTTGSVDDLRDTSGYAFMSQDYRATTGGTAPTSFLPQNGLISSAATTGLTYQLASYSANNSLKLSTLSQDSGTLVFANQFNASDVYILATSGGAASTAKVTVRFADNTSQDFTINVGDWFNGAGFAIQGIGRVSLDNNSGTIDNASGTNPRLYEFKLSLPSAYFSKPIASVGIKKTNTTGFLQVMAISVNTISPCGPPTTQPTNLQLMPTVYGVTGSFTASVPPANKYMVLRALTSAGGPDTPPVDGQTYTAGSPLGNATIVSVSASTTFSDPGLTIGTNYTYLVLGYSDSTCYGISPAYNQVNPLSGSATIPSCSATPGGTYTVGPTGTYPNLSAAMTALNNAAGASGNVIVELQPTYTSTNETFPINVPNISSSPCASGNPTLIIRPATGATGLVIAGKSIFPLLDFNGARRVTLDGRPGSTGATSQLTINNDSTAGVAIRIANDATLNTITYCDIQGRNTNNTSGITLSGVVYFGQANATTLNGNDYNTISFSNIHGNANGTPAIGISAYGTTTRKVNYNDSCTINNCNIYDFFNAGTASTGVLVGLGNNAWTINANNLYQTAARTYTAAANHRGFWITPNTGAIDSTASGFTITNNIIGGSAPAAGSTAFTLAGSVAYLFYGMDLSLGNGAVSSVQNNRVANLAITSTGTSTTTGVFAGINVANGNVNVGTLIGNMIGSATVPGSINITSGASGTSYGIRVASGATVNISKDTITGIIGSGTTGGATSTNFTGIAVSGGTSVTLSNNMIGSATVANSISLTASSSTTAQSLNGINVTAGTTVNVLNNTIANLANGYTSTGAGFTRGINVSSSTPTISGNTIRNLSNATLSTSGGNTSALVGIAMTSTSGAAIITGNTIHSLVSTGATISVAINLTGIYFSGTTSATSYVVKNNIHSFDAPADTNIVFTGVDYATGTAVVANNFIRMGIKPDGTSFTTGAVNRGISSNSSSAGNNFYYNSIYIGGTGVGTSTTPKNSYAFIRTSSSGTYDIRNNIFVNNRSNAATGGKHYAIYFTTATTGATPNYNVYNANGSGGVFAYNGTADVAAYTSGWVAGDANSAYGDPGFANATGTTATFDLHIPNGTSSIAESAATPVAFITDDYDGQNRSASTPDAGADEFNGTNPNICSGTPSPGIIRSSLTSVCPGASFTLSDSAATAAPGISFQWQSSTDSTNWQPINGATSSVYTATQTAATYYRVVVRCTSSNLSAATAGIRIVLNSFVNCYCTPTYSNGGAGDNITTVTFLTLAQTTIGNTSPYYYNYTSTQNAVPVIARNNTYPLYLTFGTDGNQWSGAWVDFNQDGIFGTTEFFSRARNVGASGKDTISIIVPAAIPSGLTRMRIRGGDDNQVNADQSCGASSSTWGQAHDYFVRIEIVAPVTLLSFTGEHKPTFNQLNWATASEQNNKGFELQRSADGVNFSAITFVASKAASGNSTATLSYSFADAKAFTGSNYYRLKQVDLDGKATYSNIVMLKGDKVNALTLSMVYPNPAKDKLNVIIASPKADKLTLIVSDITGKIVRQQSVNAIAGDNNFEVNVQALSGGSYIIKAICNDGCETVISRFVKQ